MDFLNLPQQLHINIHYNENGHRSSRSLQEYVSESKKDLQIITGSSGSGKSTFARKLTANYIDLSDYSRENIKTLHDRICKNDSSVLDSFDELSEDVAKDVLDYIQNRKVILLSRPEAIINLKHLFKSAEILEIWPFESNDVENYVKKFVVFARERTNSLFDNNDFYETHDAKSVLSYISSHQDIRSLVKNPFILALMMISFSKVESLNEKNETTTARVEIFQNFTNSWFSYHSRHSNDRENLKKFMNVYCQNVAQYFFNEGKVEMGYIALTTEEELLLLQPEHDGTLKQIYSALDDEGKQKLLTNVKRGALLSRSTDGKIKFNHRSFLEYFCSIHLFQNVFDEVNKGLPSKSEISLVSHRILEPEIMVHLTERVNVDKKFESILQKAVLLTRDVPGLDVLGSNAITILNKGGKMIFSGMDLRSIQIPFADLSGSFCGNTDFRGANLHGVNFCNAWLSCAKFDGALLSMADFGGNRRITVEGVAAILGVKYLKTVDLRSFVVAFCEDVCNGSVFVVAYDFSDFTREFCRYTLDPTENPKGAELIKGNSNMRDMISVSGTNTIAIWDFLGKTVTRRIELDGDHRIVSVMPCLKYVYTLDGGVVQSYKLMDDRNIIRSKTPNYKYVCEYDGLLRQNISNVYSVVEFVEDDIFYFVSGIGALFVLNKKLEIKLKIHDKNSYANVSCMTVFPAKKLVAFGGAQSGIVIRDYETGNKITQMLRDGDLLAYTTCMAFSTNGKYLASGIEHEGKWLVYDLHESTLVASFAEAITSIDFFPSTSASSVIHTEGKNSFQVIFEFNSDLTKKRFVSKQICQMALSDEKMYLLSQLGNHEFRARICDHSPSQTFTTFDVVLGDKSKGPNELGADVKLFSPFLQFDCLLLILYKLQNLEKYWLSFCSVQPFQMLLNTIDCTENDWQLHTNSKFAIKDNYLAYSTKNDVRLLVGEMGEWSEHRISRLPNFDHKPFETFPASNVRSLFFDDKRLLYYSGGDQKIHVISMLNWEEEKNLHLPTTPVDFYVINDRLYYLNAYGELYSDTQEAMLCQLGFRSKNRKILNDTIVFAGTGSTQPTTMYLAFVRCSDHQIRNEVQIPLWFVPDELYFHHPNELKLIALQKHYQSHFAVFCLENPDGFNNDWRLEQVTSYSSYLDTTHATFDYIYGLGHSIVKNATRAPDVDVYVKRASLLAPLIHIPTNEHTERIIRVKNESIEVNENRWIISAVQQKVTVGDHVYLLLEGVFNGKRFVSKMHLVTHDKIVCVRAYSFKIGNIEKLKEIQNELEAQQWSISDVEGKELIDSVLTDKQVRQDFNIFNQNCAVWAKMKLEKIGIFLKARWYNFLIVLPSDIYKK